MVMVAEPVTRRARAPQTPATAPSVAQAPSDPFTLPHFRAWASDLILDTGESWHPEDFQEAFAEDLFSGVPECWLVVPEGNGKTTLLAGLALYHAEFRPFAVVPVAAASREQAEIMYRQAEGFVLRSERLYASVHSAIQAAKGKRKTDVPRFLCLEGYRRINHHAGGRIQVFAADDRTGDGIIPTLGIIDEPHRQRDLSLYRTWSGKLNKRGGQLATISTSGEPGSDFEETRDRIRETGEVTRVGAFTRVRSGRVVLHEWAVPEGEDVDDMAAVKRANPFTGITLETLTEKRNSPTMTAHHWLRFVCNRPTLNDDTWLGPEGVNVWADLLDPYLLRSDIPTYIGVDVAIRHDTTAVVVMQRRTDGAFEDRPRFHAVCRLFVPEEDKPIDVTDVMAHLRRLAVEYHVEAIAFDRRFFDVPAKMLADDGLPMIDVPQESGIMTAACGSLYEAIMRGQITHDDDQPFGNQVLAASARESERGFRLSKGKSRGKIDAAIALALAYDQVLRHETDEPSVYVDRGLVAV